MQMITLGGNAELELVDSLDPFSEGIVLSVRPPKKSWKNITDLSGGEKTLSSLALVSVCCCCLLFCCCCLLFVVVY
jgi:structural maintenance of chromosome 4